MTFFNTQQGSDIGYRLQFETDDKDKFLFMQEQARKCVDNRYKDDTVRHGHWIKVMEYLCIPDSTPIKTGNFYYKCSECSRGVMALESYCPNCGAKMDEEETEQYE